MNDTQAVIDSRPTQEWTLANRSYLDFQVRRLRLLLHRRVLWLRSQWAHDPHREAVSQVVSDEHADWLLRDADPQTTSLFYATNAEAVEVGTQVAACERRIEALLGDLGRRPPALEVLARTFRLGPFERDVILLCFAPDWDASLRTLYAYAQDDMTRPWPTGHLALALACDAVTDAGERASLRELLSETATLRRLQLVRAGGSGEDPTPVAHRALLIDERIVDYLYGINRPDERLAPLLEPVEGAAVAPAHAEVAGRMAAILLGRPEADWPLVNLVGPPDSGQAEVASAVCSRTRIRLYRLDLPRLRSDPAASAVLGLAEREALLLQIAFYIELDEETRQDPALLSLLSGLSRHRNLLTIVSSREPVMTARAPLLVRVERPEAPASIGLWRQTLGPQAAAVDAGLPALTQQFDLGPQAMRQAVGHANQQAQLARQPLTAAHLWAASRDGNVSELDQLAQRIQPAYTWQDLVLSEAVTGQLRQMASQVAQRYTVYEKWKFSSHVSRGRGISALFAGASGTGKTMAAEVLANVLSLALYRIDLASLFNKFVGETEKNMRRIFEAAERTGALLFFDEADAVFGKRTEVKDSHDRFANIEIGYLLQRMESYWGVVILATNRRGALDRAFLRRLRFVVDFAFPDLDCRLRLWRKAFPAETPVEALDYARLAALEITGGSIRTIALSAAFMAAADGRAVGMPHLMAAAHWEYLKIDKLETEAEFGEYLGRF